MYKQKSKEELISSIGELEERNDSLEDQIERYQFYIRHKKYFYLTSVFGDMWKEIKGKIASFMVKITMFLLHKVVDRDSSFCHFYDALGKVHKGLIVDNSMFVSRDSVGEKFDRWFHGFLPEELANMRKNNPQEAKKGFEKLIKKTQEYV